MPESLYSGIGVACTHSCAKASDKDMPSVTRYAVYSILLGMLHIGVQSLYSYHLEMGDVEMIQGRRALLVRKLAHNELRLFCRSQRRIFSAVFSERL